MFWDGEKKIKRKSLGARLKKKQLRFSWLLNMLMQGKNPCNSCVCGSKAGILSEEIIILKMSLDILIP